MKRLYRLEKDKKIAGVCAGLGEYFNLDPVVFRILFISLSIFWGGGILLYLVFWFSMPKRKDLENENNKNC